MSRAEPGQIASHLRRILDPGSPAGVEDARLLERFLQQHDEGAFAWLVWRHGHMVRGVCHRVLGNEHDTEDAFQATFLTLVRKGSSLGKREALAGWLYRVAYRIALRARASHRTVSGEAAEKVLKDLPGAEDPIAEVSCRDLLPVLDAEIHALPEKYRTPVVLCYLQGKTCTEAAALLGWPRGTLATRLKAGRELLRERLLSRGLAPTGLPWLLLLEGTRSPPGKISPLVDSTVRNGVALVRGQTAAVPARVMALTNEVIKTMFLTRLQLVGGLLLSLGLLTAGTGLAVFQPGAKQPPPGDPAAAVQKGEKGLGGKGTRADAKKTDLDRLQGAWLSTSIQVGDEAAKAEAPPSLLLIFKKDQVTLNVEGSEGTGTVLLRPERKPKEMDIRISDREGAVAIYRLAGDRLTVCLIDQQKQRPTTFEPKGKEMRVDFRRISARELEQVRKKDGVTQRIRVLNQEIAALKAQNAELQALIRILRDRLEQQQKQLPVVLGKIDIAKNTLSFQLRDTTLTLDAVPLSDKVQFSLDGKKCTINDLKKGMPAALRLETHEGKTVVTDIAATREKETKGATSGEPASFVEKP
jgi:RNA polymerase sigma factor (sigma-70 family)